MVDWVSFINGHAKDATAFLNTAIQSMAHILAPDFFLFYFFLYVCVAFGSVSVGDNNAV